MTKFGTNNGKQWSKRWVTVGLRMANSGTNNGKQWHLHAMAMSGSNF